MKPNSALNIPLKQHSSRCQAFAGRCLKCMQEHEAVTVLRQLVKVEQPKKAPVTQEEAVVKRLTAEELAELRYFHAPKGEYVPATSLKKDTLHSLLAMASRLVELESALDYLRERRAMVCHPDNFVLLARELGWTSPTQKQGDR